MAWIHRIAPTFFALCTLGGPLAEASVPRTVVIEEFGTVF
jgi:hypothetical protein